MKRVGMVSVAIAIISTLGMVGCGAKTGTMVSDSQTSTLQSHDPTLGFIYGKPARNGIPAAVRLADLQKSNTWYNLDMVDAEIGYRFGYMNGQFAIQRTDDGANRWSSLKMPMIFKRTSLAMGSGEIENPNVQIVNADTIYLYAMMPTGELLMYHSTDAGGHWSMHRTGIRNGRDARLCSVSQPGNLDAWVLLQAGTSAGSDYRLLHIQKGGTVAYEQQVHLGANHLGLPASKSAAVAFTNATTGWIVDVTKQGQLRLYSTVDAGNRWTSRVLRSPAALIRWQATRVFQPTILESEGVFTVVYTKVVNGHKHDKTVVFRSRDAGAHFTGEVVDKLDDAMASYSGNPTYFMSPDYGYSINDGRLVRTTDTGTSWLTVHSPTLEMQLRNYPSVLAIDYASDPVGFMLLGSRDHRQSILLHTRDEGDTWSKVGQ